MNIDELQAMQALSLAVDGYRERALTAEARIEAIETLLSASEARAAQWQADAERYRIDAEVYQDRLAALQKRTEAEQRVLDACAAWNARKTPPSSTGQWSLIYGDVAPIADAELARREILRG